MSVWVTLEGHRQHTLMLLCLCEPRLVLVPLLQGRAASFNQQCAWDCSRAPSSTRTIVAASASALEPVEQ